MPFLLQPFNCGVVDQAPEWKGGATKAMLLSSKAQIPVTHQGSLPLTWRGETHQAAESGCGAPHPRGLCFLPSTPLGHLHEASFSAELLVLRKGGKGNQGRLPGGGNVMTGCLREEIEHKRKQVNAAVSGEF